jgi:hypothetical protein
LELFGLKSLDMTRCRHMTNKALKISSIWLNAKRLVRAEKRLQRSGVPSSSPGSPSPPLNHRVECCSIGVFKHQTFSVSMCPQSTAPHPDLITAPSVHLIITSHLPRSLRCCGVASTGST